MTFDELEECRAWLDLTKEEMHRLFSGDGKYPDMIGAHFKTLKRLNPDVLVSILNEIRENK